MEHALLTPLPAQRRVLIITSSGGGAHLIAAEAVRERLCEDVSVESIHTVDLLQDWTGAPGRWGATFWNRAMQRGDVRRMDQAISLIHVTDFVIQAVIRQRLEHAIREQRVNEIFDCQVMATRIVLETAARFAVPMTKVLTEPAHAALSQYRRPIRRLPGSLRKSLRLWASRPLLEDGETEESFWRERWGLDPGQVDTTSGFPVRAAFASGLCEIASPLSIEAANSEAAVEIPADARLITVVMGSQATLGFTRDAVMSSVESHDDPASWVVAYVPDDRMRHELKTWAESRGTRTRLVMRPYFEPEILAELYRRSRATVTRSGGMTSMELLSAGRAPALVFSRGHRKSAHAGMVKHELGNFRYVERFHEPGAWVVDRDDLADRLTAITSDRSASHVRTRK